MALRFLPPVSKIRTMRFLRRRGKKKSTKSSKQRKDPNNFFPERTSPYQGIEDNEVKSNKSSKSRSKLSLRSFYSEDSNIDDTSKRSVFSGSSWSTRFASRRSIGIPEEAEDTTSFEGLLNECYADSNRADDSKKPISKASSSINDSSKISITGSIPEDPITENNLLEKPPTQRSSRASMISEKEITVDFSQVPLVKENSERLDSSGRDLFSHSGRAAKAPDQEWPTKSSSQPWKDTKIFSPFVTLPTPEDEVETESAVSSDIDIGSLGDENTVYGSVAQLSFMKHRQPEQIDEEVFVDHPSPTLELENPRSSHSDIDFDPMEFVGRKETPPQPVALRGASETGSEPRLEGTSVSSDDMDDIVEVTSECETQKMPSPSESYSVVSLSFLAPNIPSDVSKRVFKEALRITKPGGLIYVVDIHGETVKRVSLMKQSLSRIPDDEVEAQNRTINEDAAFGHLRIAHWMAIKG